MSYIFVADSMRLGYLHSNFFCWLKRTLCVM